MTTKITSRLSFFAHSVRNLIDLAFNAPANTAWNDGAAVTARQNDQYSRPVAAAAALV